MTSKKLGRGQTNTDKWPIESQESSDQYPFKEREKFIKLREEWQRKIF
jgi:hypothetical protein